MASLLGITGRGILWARPLNSRSQKKPRVVRAQLAVVLNGRAATWSAGTRCADRRRCSGCANGRVAGRAINAKLAETTTSTAWLASGRRHARRRCATWLEGIFEILSETICKTFEDHAGNRGRLPSILFGRFIRLELSNAPCASRQWPSGRGWILKRWLRWLNCLWPELPDRLAAVRRLEFAGRQHEVRRLA